MVGLSLNLRFAKGGWPAAVGSIFKPAQLQGDPSLEQLFQIAKRAQTKDRQLIFTIGNHHAVLALLPVYLTSMRMADSADMTQHVVVVCTDRPAHDMCIRLHRWCWCDGCDAPPGPNGTESMSVGAGLAPPTPGAQSPGEGAAALGGQWAPSPAAHRLEERLKGASFSAIGWRRQEIAAGLVDAGFHTVAMDMDIVVFRNFLRGDVLPQIASVDLLVQKEHFDQKDQLANIGFYSARSTAATKRFFREWLSEEHRHEWDQAAFNDLLLPTAAVPELRWQHIPILQGANICVVRRLHKGPVVTYQDWRRAADTFCAHDRVLSDAVFFHTACWKPEVQFVKAEAMAAMQLMYHQHKNDLRQVVAEATCEEQLANCTRAVEHLSLDLRGLDAARRR